MENAGRKELSGKKGEIATLRKMNGVLVYRSFQWTGMDDGTRNVEKGCTVEERTEEKLEQEADKVLEVKE